MNLHLEFIKEFNDKLAGKTIVSIENAERAECVAKFNLADGSSFYLYGTDLGNWIENGPDVDNYFSTLKSLIQAIDRDVYQNFKYTDLFEKNSITFDIYHNKVLCIYVKNIDYLYRIRLTDLTTEQYEKIVENGDLISQLPMHLRPEEEC